MRKGFDSLATLAQQNFWKEDTCGAFVRLPRLRRRDSEGLWLHAEGLCLFAKRLEKVGPSLADGRVMVRPAQLAILL